MASGVTEHLREVEYMGERWLCAGWVGERPATAAELEAIFAAARDGRSVVIDGIECTAGPDAYPVRRVEVQS
jgi:hypothetical protein